MWPQIKTKETRLGKWLRSETFAFTFTLFLDNIAPIKYCVCHESSDILWFVSKSNGIGDSIW
jgi:hypothetical protein